MWENNLERIFYRAFKKKRVVNSTKKSHSQNDFFLEERRKLIKKMARHPTPEISIMISDLEEKIGLENIQMNTNHMRSQLTSGSNFVTTHNTNGCWSLVKKVRPKYLPTVPVGKINKEGKITTNQEGLKELYLETFLLRLRDRPIRPDLVDLQLIKNKMFETILKTCTKKRADPWTLKQLEKVLDGLKKDKCRDPKGLINELFFHKSCR